VLWWSQYQFAAVMKFLTEGVGVSKLSKCGADPCQVCSESIQLGRLSINLRTSLYIIPVI